MTTPSAAFKLSICCRRGKKASPQLHRNHLFLMKLLHAHRSLSLFFLSSRLRINWNSRRRKSQGMREVGGKRGLVKSWAAKLSVLEPAAPLLTWLPLTARQTKTLASALSDECSRMEHFYKLWCVDVLWALLPVTFKSSVRQIYWQWERGWICSNSSTVHKRNG